MAVAVFCRRLLHLPFLVHSHEMIRNIRQIYLVRVLGLRANADALQRLLPVMERTNFSFLPDDWSRRGEGHSMAPGRRGSGADYMFYNPHKQPALAVNEVCLLVRAPRARLPAEHPVSWDFEALARFECELDVEVGVGSGIHDHVIGWDGKVPVDDDNIMAERNEGSGQNGNTAAVTASHMSISAPDGVCDETIPGARTSASAGGIDGTLEGDLVSGFGSAS